MNELGFSPFAPRKTAYLGVRDQDGHRLKQYSVVFGEDGFEANRFEAGLVLALDCVPPPDVSLGRLGLGFVIFHQGNSCDYLVLSWWDRENELPTRVFVGESGLWRPARDGESFCVWDLEIIAFERDAYINTVLRSSGASIQDYLAVQGCA